MRIIPKNMRIIPENMRIPPENVRKSGKSRQNALNGYTVERRTTFCNVRNVFRLPAYVPRSTFPPLYVCGALATMFDWGRASRLILYLGMLVGCSATVVPAPRPGFVHPQKQLLPLARRPECWTRTCARRVVVAAKRGDQDGARKRLSDPDVVAHMQVLRAGRFHVRCLKQGHG